MRPVRGGAGYLAVEALYAARHEGVLHLDDVLTRRTRISLETPDRGAEAAEDVAGLLAPALGWEPARRHEEVAGYRSRLAAERAGEKLEDESANRARSVWRDPRLDRVGLG